MEYILGYLKSVKFHNDINQYSVISLKLDQKKDESVTVVGYFKIPLKDELVKFGGEFYDNEKYGKQFKAESIESILPNSRVSIIRFLSSSLFKGVGEKLATKIVDALGEDCLNIIKENPESLNQLDIKEEKKFTIIEGIKKHQNLNEAIKIFVGHGISMKYLIKMDAIYGENLIDIVLSNPYRLIKDIDGLGFKTVDKIALSLGIEQDNPNRIRSLILYVLKNICYKTLNTYTNINLLFNESKKALPLINSDIFMDMYCDLKDSMDIIEDEKGRVFAKDIYEAEKGIATLLNPYIKDAPILYDRNKIIKEIKKIEFTDGIIYTDEQVETIINCINSNISIITGGPGTGKTTILNAIIKVYSRLKKNSIISLVAPTGRAAKRMSQLSGFSACTIHRLLKWDLDSATFQVNYENPIYGDFLVVDEFSMVDCQLFYNLLLGTYNYSKILLIGDDKQLEPLCPGTVLKDMIESNTVLVNRLYINHRQIENSGIVYVANDINKGVFNEENLKNGDVFMVEEKTSTIRNKLLSIVQELIAEGYSESDIQVIAPMYDGVIGINSINDLLREYFNPKTDSKKEFRIGTTLYRVNDKILQLKNQPDDNVFNGDIGYLVDIIQKEETQLLIDFDGNIVKYSSNEFQNISHGYAISVHKSQGSEYGVVIMAVAKEHQKMLKRKLLYTGVSRAKEKLYILGSMEEFIKGINRAEETKKDTTLKERLLESNIQIS